MLDKAQAGVRQAQARRKRWSPTGEQAKIV